MVWSGATGLAPNGAAAPGSGAAGFNVCNVEGVKVAIGFNVCDTGPVAGLRR